MPKHIIKQGPLSAYRWYRRVQRYSKYASMVSVLCAFGGCDRIPALKQWHRAKEIA